MVNVIASIAGDEMAPASEILASLDRALAEAVACKIATKPEAATTPEPVATQDNGAGLSKPSIVAIPSTHSYPTPSPYTPSVTIPSTPSQSQVLLKARAEAEAFLTGPWRKLWSHQKAARAFVVAQKAGGLSFTLNLTGGLQKTLSKHADPARLMSHYINRELRKDFSFPFPYAFRFEVSSAGRLHLHGVVVPLSFHEDHLYPLAEALARAGGKHAGYGGSRNERITAALRRSTQFHLDFLYDGLGWFAYCQKTADDAAHFLGTDKVTFISAPLTKMCRR